AQYYLAFALLTPIHTKTASSLSCGSDVLAEQSGRAKYGVGSRASRGTNPCLGGLDDDVSSLNKGGSDLRDFHIRRDSRSFENFSVNRRIRRLRKLESVPVGQTDDIGR